MLLQENTYSRIVSRVLAVDIITQLLVHVLFTGFGERGGPH